MNYFSLVAGDAVSRVDSDSMGLHPSWRKAPMHVSLGVGWAEGAPSSEMEKLRAEVALNLKKVSDLQLNSERQATSKIKHTLVGFKNIAFGQVA
jgi:hypothetical protein